ncbi:MAG: sulfurtransferase [Gammaproteobacteria bacterium RIFCSPHIGHO2_12_FULL_42_13]|nr:MAG: sulfurtransferase [Gammaproteobacteria bacterium RIFCSPHIGHO2_12_FULL_42_13]
MKQHATRFLNLVEKAKNHIKEISPQQLKEKLNRRKSIILIDVRDEREWNSGGHIPGAIHLSKGVIERDIEKRVQDPETEMVVYCSGGFRCALVAESLQKMGYQNVYSLESGLTGWIDAGYSLEAGTND